MTDTQTTLTTGEGGPDPVYITVLPGLAHPFAWWSEDHILALRPCAVEGLPAALEAAAARIRETSAVPVVTA